MGRVYTASFEAVTVSAAQDFFEINAPSSAAVVIHSCEIGQSSDPGDAEAELLRVKIQRSTGTAGSGGTAGVTAVPHLLGYAAFGGTIATNNTVPAETLTVVRATTFNAQAGWFYVPTPEERIWIPPSGRLVISLGANPADGLTMSGSVTFEAFG